MQKIDVSYSNKNALKRLVRCIFVEKLIDPKQLSPDPAGRGIVLPVPHAHGFLLFENLVFAPADTFLNEGDILFLRENNTSQRVEKVSDLFDFLVPLLSFTPSKQGLNKTIEDIENSIVNDAQARAYRVEWNGALRRSIQASDHNGLIDYMFNAHDTRKATILMDQWGSLEGHPFYPTWKTKPNLSAQDVKNLSPEFGAVVSLRIAALRKDMAYIESTSSVSSYHEWFSGYFPVLYTQWKKNLDLLGHNPVNWLPVPIHSWHLDHHIRKDYRADIEAGVLIVDGPDLPSRPSMSFRTMLPETPENAPFIKLPVAIWLTSELRGLQAKSINMGPRFSEIIAKIFTQEKGFDHTLEYMPEDLGFHYKHAQRQDDNEGKHLSVVFRPSAQALNRNDGLRPITVAALFAASPLNERPLITELVETQGTNVKDFFRRYVAVVLKPVLSMYTLYGITIEAHQQNSSILFDREGIAHRLLIRDYGDARAYSPLLERRGYKIKPYRYGKILSTVFDESIEPVRTFIINAVFVCHLHEIALTLSHEYQIKDESLWHIIGQEVERIFNDLEPRVHDREFWKCEKDIFLHHPWPARSLLSMHLQEYADYRMNHFLTNPLKKI